MPLLANGVVRRRLVRRTALVGGAALLAVGTLVGPPTDSAALLTGTATTTSATVTVGSVSLALSNGAATGSWLGSVSLKPGEDAYARLDVRNTGAFALAYSVTATSSSSLAPLVSTSVAVITTGSSCTSSTFAAGTVVSNSATTLGTVAGQSLVGDRSAGVQATDRALAAGRTDTLCLRATLVLGAGRQANGATISSTFTVDGTTT